LAEKARQDSIATAKEQARLAEISRLAKEKATADSLAQEKEKSRQAELAASAEKARLDNLAREVRVQAMKDSLVLVKQKQEEENAKLALEKKKQDEVIAEQKRLKEIEDQKKALSGSSTNQAPKKNPNDISAYKIDFDKQFIPDGIQDETIKESNRTILRTIVKSKDVQATFLKVTYGYGGVFFFKNSSSISESIYNLELQNLRKQLKN
jgi:multidrug efflux pump subunit AcrA (membrane-fusion protein)